MGPGARRLVGLGLVLLGAFWVLAWTASAPSPQATAAAVYRATSAGDAETLFRLLERRVMKPDFPEAQRRAILGTLLPRLWAPPLNAGLQSWCRRLEAAQGDAPTGPASDFYRAVLRATPLGAYRSKTGYAAGSPALGKAMDWFSVHLKVKPPTGAVSLPPAYGGPGGPYNASHCRGIHVTVTAPAGRFWTLALSEDGWDRPEAAYRGTDGADGERWYLEPRRGTGNPVTEYFLFSELRPDPLRGNQRGDGALDTQALVRVDVMAEGGVADLDVGPLYFTP